MSATVAVVGRGFGAAVHAPGWELAGAHVVGVAGREGWRDLVGKADIVSVATPPSAHREVVLEALRRGARVLCEKPLAATLGDAELLEKAVRGTPNAVSFGYRAVPAFSRFRELLAADELAVFWTTGSRVRPGPPGWKDDPLHGGALSAYGVHAFDYARWLLGEAKVERATVAPNEDSFTAVLAHEGGRRTRVTVSLLAEAPVHRLEAGDLVLENRHATDPVGAFTLTDRGRAVDVPALQHQPGADPRVGPFASLALALLEDRERPTFTDGLQAQRLMDEVRRTAS
ncbi:MAG: Gfo/Idh/MocA family oxidoreductase [Actinobacteria bacterium]|nr:Gfo/Idh/MocA family oxidoreductase [Actinomycetota bacterium]